MNLITKALVFAAQAHDGQLSDDGTAYIYHPIAVAGIVASRFPDDELAQAVALLHDTVEDTDVTLSWLAGVFGQEVADAVESVTHRGNEPHIDFVQRSAKHPVGRIVKHADILHNHYVRPPVENAERRARLRKKYSAALDFLEREDNPFA